MVQLLVESRADVNAKGPDNWTPLHLAAFHGRKDMVDIIMHPPAMKVWNHRDC